MNRREVLTGTAAAFAVPASDRINVGFIGAGTRGGDGLIKMFLPLSDCRCAAVCDTFRDRRERRTGQIDEYYRTKGCTAIADFRELLARKDIDAVAIATPDHWHALIAIAAARAGKDIYLEKPLALTVEQGKAVRAAVRKHGRVFQYGTQQRSMAHVRHGCELVRNGRIGKVHTVEVSAPCGRRGGSTDPMAIPEGFDYEMWTGPAPMRPFTKERAVEPGHYHIYDYALGMIAGWGAHPLDVAQWGLGTDGASPVEYEGTGRVPHEGLYDAISNWTVRCRYANGVVMHFTDDHSDRTRFIGTEGWVSIRRSGLETEPAWLAKSEIRPDGVRLHRSANQAQDFLDSIRSRKETVNPVESAVRSDAISHLADIAIRTGRKIRWDPAGERIIDDAAASRMLDRTVRAPWRL